MSKNTCFRSSWVYTQHSHFRLLMFRRPVTGRNTAKNLWTVWPPMVTTPITSSTGLSILWRAMVDKTSLITPSQTRVSTQHLKFLSLCRLGHPNGGITSWTKSKGFKVHSITCRRVIMASWILVSRLWCILYLWMTSRVRSSLQACIY